MDEPLQYDDELLIRFIDGDLPPADKDRIENQLKTDAALSQRIENLRLSVSAIRYYGNVQAVRSIHNEMMQELGAPSAKIRPLRSRLRFVIGIAASILLVVVAISLYISSRVTPAKLYDEAYVDYRVSITRGDEQPSAIKSLYNQGAYDAVIRQANRQLLQEDSLLVGLSYLKTNELDGAIRQLSAIRGPGMYAQDAEFYLSLAYLKNKDYDPALRLMRKIRSEPDHPYRSRFSEGFIKKMEKLNKN